MTRRSSGGFALVPAIFLLVVLAGLGVFAVRLVLLQQQTVTSGLRAAQALNAARAGVAWASYRALALNVCGAATLNLTEGATAGFTVTVDCAQSTHVEGADTIAVYVIDVRAESGAYGGSDYVSRRVQAKVTDAV
jgi:MSHA biogenesis protein MshP